MYGGQPCCCNGICIKRLELKLPSVMFSHFKSSMFQDKTPNELYHLDGPWDVKLPAFEFVLFYLFPHLTLERKRFGFLLPFKTAL